MLGTIESNYFIKMIAAQLVSVFNSVVSNEGLFKRDTDEAGLKFLFTFAPLLKKMRLKSKHYPEVSFYHSNQKHQQTRPNEGFKLFLGH